MPWLIGWVLAEVLHTYESEKAFRWCVRAAAPCFVFLLLAALDEMGLSIVVVIATVLFNNEIGTEK